MSPRKEAQAKAYQEFQERMQITPIVEYKPYVVGYLVKTGVREGQAKRLMTADAYRMLYIRLSAMIGIRKCSPIKPLYWLWTHGIAIDALGSFTEDEAMAMLKMIWAKNKAKSGVAA